jgi:hypothetical protein
MSQGACSEKFMKPITFHGKSIKYNHIFVPLWDIFLKLKLIFTFLSRCKTIFETPYKCFKSLGIGWNHRVTDCLQGGEKGKTRKGDIFGWGRADILYRAQSINIFQRKGKLRCMDLED